MKHRVEIVQKSPKELIPYAKNAKKHPPEQIAKIASQIHSFGFDQPIVVDKNMVIIKGHGRREAAIQLNMDTVPVVVADWLDEYQAMAARIGDNKVALSDTDFDFLKFDLGTLSLRDFDTKLTGFDLPEIEGILKSEEITPEVGLTQAEYASLEAEEGAGIRQIILVYDEEKYNQLLQKFEELQQKFGVFSNSEVIEHLIEAYESHSNKAE